MKVRSCGSLTGKEEKTFRLTSNEMFYLFTFFLLFYFGKVKDDRSEKTSLFLNYLIKYTLPHSFSIKELISVNSVFTLNSLTTDYCELRISRNFANDRQL